MGRGRLRWYGLACELVCTKMRESAFSNIRTDRNEIHVSTLCPSGSCLNKKKRIFLCSCFFVFYRPGGVAYAIKLACVVRDRLARRARQRSVSLYLHELFSSVPRGRSFVLDAFKDYGSEVGVKAILSDSLMLVATLLLSEAIDRTRREAKVVILMVTLYVGLFVLHSKKRT